MTYRDSDGDWLPASPLEVIGLFAALGAAFAVAVTLIWWIV